jgi:serine/threonine protein phosphatase 1
VNHAGRDIVVGDIHGQGAMLHCLLSLAKFDPAQDRLVALGDLIDRGPDGAALIERFERDPAWISLCGNHEAMMQAATLSWDASRVWSQNSNTWAATQSSDALDHLSGVVKGFPLAIELPLMDGRTIGLIHAEVPPGRSWAAMRGLEFSDAAATDDGGSSDVASALWGRRRAVADAWMRKDPDAADCKAATQVRAWRAAQPIPNIDLVVCGHAVLKPPVPRGRGNVLWIDTGACYPEGRLTAVDVAAACYWQVDHECCGTWGPFPLPTPESPAETWRPTAEVEAAAAAHDARQLELLRLLLP